MTTRFCGWEAHILRHEFVRLVITPELGGRVMAYDLGEHAPLWINPALHGQVAQPVRSAVWPNVGGYKTWPAPDAEWDWPPPPLLDHGHYAVDVVRDATGAQIARLTGPVEQWVTPGLRFDRTLTLLPASTRVRVDQTLVNESDRPARWSVWDITQVAIESAEGAGDYDRYPVYFPLNPKSVFGARGVHHSAESAAWQGAVAPGVYGVVFRPDNAKVFGDPATGWITYTDQHAGIGYAKLFETDESAEYPDGGARVEVWVNRDPQYLEVEVLGPLTELAANGGATTFSVMWGACTYGGGVVRHASVIGLVAERLAYDGEQRMLAARGGVFDAGAIRIVWLDANGAWLHAEPPQPVTPLEVLDVRVQVVPPPGAARVALVAQDRTGATLGEWDSVAL